MALFKYLRSISTSGSSRQDDSVVSKAHNVVCLVEDKGRSQAQGVWKRRGKYIKLSLEKKGKIGKYTSVNEVANAVKHYKDLNLKKSSVTEIGEMHTFERFVYSEKQPSLVKRLSLNKIAICLAKIFK